MSKEVETHDIIKLGILIDEIDYYTSSPEIDSLGLMSMRRIVIEMKEVYCEIAGLNP